MKPSISRMSRHVSSRNRGGKLYSFIYIYIYFIELQREREREEFGCGTATTKWKRLVLNWLFWSISNANACSTSHVEIKNNIFIIFKNCWIEIRRLYSLKTLKYRRLVYCSWKSPKLCVIGINVSLCDVIMRCNFFARSVMNYASDLWNVCSGSKKNDLFNVRECIKKRNFSFFFS